MRQVIVGLASVGLASVGLTGGVASMSGCAGSSTAAAASRAEARMATLKSGMEWQQATQAFNAGDLDKAERKVNESIAIEPDVAASHVLRARVLIERGNLGGALESLRRAEVIDPKLAEAQYYLGVVHERLDRTEEAIGHYRMASELSPGEPDAVIATAEVLISMGRAEEALAELGASPAAELSAGIRQAMGQASTMLGDRESAVRYLGEARLLSPESATIVDDLARAEVSVGRWSEAEANLAFLLTLGEYAGRVDVRRLHAMCLLELARAGEARAELVALVEGVGSSDAESWWLLGNASLRTGDRTQLRRSAERVSALEPRGWRGDVLWAMSHRLSGQAAAGLPHVERAFKRAPGEADVLAARALLLADLGRRDEARAMAERANEAAVAGVTEAGGE